MNNFLLTLYRKLRNEIRVINYIKIYFCQIKQRLEKISLLLHRIMAKLRCFI